MRHNTVSITAHTGGSAGDTLDILAPASFTWNESANFSDSGGVWSFSLNETASASLVVIATTGSSSFLMVSESAAYSLTLHDHATFSGDVSGNYTIDVSLSGDYSFNVIDFGPLVMAMDALSQWWRKRRSTE